MEFFCYHRDRPGSMPLREELAEAHWSYMDVFEPELIARGPTLADEGDGDGDDEGNGDGDIATGSVHIVDLPDPAAARAFAFNEPNYQAGVYRDVLLRRWRNLLGRTMWQFPGDPAADHLYLLLGLAAARPTTASDATPPPNPDTLLAYGPLLSDDGDRWLGTAALLQAANPDAARALLNPAHYAAVELHNWQPGGRS